MYADGLKLLVEIYAMNNCELLQQCLSDGVEIIHFHSIQKNVLYLSPGD